MSIQDTDKILINRSGSSYQVEAQNFDSIQDDDLLLVNRNGQSFQCKRSDLDSKLQDDDVLLINRGSNSFKCTGSQFSQLLGPPPGTQKFNVVKFTGTGSPLAVPNDVDCSTGAFVWNKAIGNGDHMLWDTIRGTGNRFSPNNNAANDSTAAGNNQGLTEFTQNGFKLGNDYQGSNTAQEYISYCWRKAPDFMDIVDCPNGAGTYNHDLGVKPGMIIAKSVTTGDWYVYFANNNVSSYALLNSTASNVYSPGVWGPDTTVPNSTQFVLGPIFGSNRYIAYLFPVNNLEVTTSSYAASSGALRTITTGYRPRFVMLKCWTMGGNPSYTDNWYIFDSQRGAGKYLLANDSSQEGSTTDFAFTDTGFTVKGQLAVGFGQYSFLAMK